MTTHGYRPIKDQVALEPQIISSEMSYNISSSGSASEILMKSFNLKSSMQLCQTLWHITMCQLTWFVLQHIFLVSVESHTMCYYNSLGKAVRVKLLSKHKLFCGELPYIYIYVCMYICIYIIHIYICLFFYKVSEIVYCIWPTLLWTLPYESSSEMPMETWNFS